MIAVLGATGTNGREVIKALRQKNAAVRAIARNPAKANDLTQLGATVVAGDLDKAETLVAAFQGATTLFLLSPVAPNQFDLEMDALAAARTAGVGRVVKLSAIGADPLASGQFSRVHGASEAALRSSGLGWTIVRGAFFYSNLLFSADGIKQGSYIGHWGSHKAAWIDPIDLAGVCAECLVNPSYVGQTLIATGPEAFNNETLVSKLSSLLGRPIRNIDLSPEEYSKTLQQYGMPAWLAEAEVALRRIVISGEAQETTHVVSRLLGREPRTIDQYIRENAKALTAP